MSFWKEQKFLNRLKIPGENLNRESFNRILESLFFRLLSGYRLRGKRDFSNKTDRDQVRSAERLSSSPLREIRSEDGVQRAPCFCRSAQKIALWQRGLPVFFLLVFALRVFAGDADSSLSLKNFAESVVQVEVETQSAADGPVEIFSGSGFLVKDSAGEIKVVSSFHTINAVLNGESAKALIKYKGRSFTLREQIALFPKENLVVASVAWDSETPEGITPLPVRDSFPEEKESAFLWGFPGRKGKLKPFMLGKREEGVFGRLSFLARTRETLEGGSGGPITDGRGRVFSVLISAASNHGEGLEVGVLSRVLAAAPLNDCFSSLRDCVLEARRELYRTAKQGDKSARRQLLKYHLWGDIKAFELFAKSIGKEDTEAIQKDFYDFLRSTARDDLFAQSVLTRLTGYPEDQREFRERSFKRAENGDFQAQYFAGRILLNEDDLSGGLGLLELSATQGLWPARKLIQRIERRASPGPDEPNRPCRQSLTSHP